MSAPTPDELSDATPVDKVLTDAIEEELSLGGDPKSCASYVLSALADASYVVKKMTVAEECERDSGVGAHVHSLGDYRAFDVGTPTRCYRCGTSEAVTKQGGDGGYVWGCPNCGHPAD